MKEKIRALTQRTAIIATIAGGALLGVMAPDAYAHYCGSDTAQCNGCMAGYSCSYPGIDCKSCCDSACIKSNCGDNSICAAHCLTECYNWCSGTPCPF